MNQQSRPAMSGTPVVAASQGSRRVETLIVGGGPSGLAAAYALQGDTLILEKESRVGGLCRSIEHGGGVFDIGGHSFHTPHPEVHDLVETVLDGGPILQQRDARVYSHGTLIPYPFQKFYDRLPDAEVVRACEEGLRTRGAGGEPADFEEYIIRNFGRGIADHFMLPYNRKLWARDIRKISCEWTSERVAAPKGQSERFDTTGGHRKPLQADTQVGYPRTGGFEQIFRGFVPRVPEVALNSAVAHIDPFARLATTRDGRQFHWDRLITTMPLPELARIVQDTPAEVVEMADALEYMSLRVELLLAGRRLKTTLQRIYSADPEIPPHKIALNHNSSPSLRERPCHAIMAEVSISPEKPVDVESIAPLTIDLLCRLEVLATPDDIVWTDHVDVKYAYPVYTHERPALLRGIKDWMGKHQIHTLGRFGDWEYVNSDRCVMKGLALGARLREIEALA